MKAKQIYLSFCAILISCFVPIQAQTLINEQEAALPAYVSKSASRSIIRGPVVKWINPKNGIVVSSPFELKVLLEPREGVKIDPSSLVVTYLKSPLVDLMPRLQTSVTPSGIELKQAIAPPGLHTIRLTVKDIEGRETNSQITIQVK
jgi:hypothetical protein